MDMVLNDKKMRDLLENKKLMMDKSWHELQIKAAKYDLRVGREFLIFPDGEDGTRRERRYGDGEERVEDIILEPNEVAFVSTMELMCIPWNITGHISIGFDYPIRSLLVLTGLVVDPGYGMQKKAKAGKGSDGGDMWEPKGERLHFIVQNIGQKPVSLKPGKDRVASIQFLEIDAPEAKDPPSSVSLEKGFFGPDRAPLAGLFGHFATRIAELTNDHKTLRADLESHHQQLSRDIENMKSGTHNVIFFGVYLLAASLAATMIYGLLSLVTSDKFLNLQSDLVYGRWLPELLVVAGFLVVFLSLVVPIVAIWDMRKFLLKGSTPRKGVDG